MLGNREWEDVDASPLDSLNLNGFNEIDLTGKKCCAASCPSRCIIELELHENKSA